MQKSKKIRPGGPRGLPTYDPNGFFAIDTDQEAGKITLKHYQPDSPPRPPDARKTSRIYGVEPGKGLISQLSHAGYLGIELAKAEAALRLGLSYEQNHPIKKET